VPQKHVGNIAARFLRGYRRIGIFAVTSKCNCRCEMCDIYLSKPFDIGFPEATRVLDFMAKNEFLVAYFTGGEPSLHPRLVDIVDYAVKCGLLTSLTTNGTIPEKTLKALHKVGLHSLSVSVDSWNPQICSKIRGFKDILEKQKKTVELAKKLKMGVYTLTYLGLHITEENIEDMVEYVNNTLGVPFALCYPTETDVNTYQLGNRITMHSPSSFQAIARKLLALKKRGYKIANTATYLEEIIRFHDKKPTKYPCKCGEYVFYIDWFGDLYPCFTKDKLFNILELTESDAKPYFPKNVACNQCLVDCFREPSYLAYLKDPMLTLREINHNFPVWGMLF